MIVHVGMTVKTTFSVALDTADPYFPQEIARYMKMSAQNWATEMECLGTGMREIGDHDWEEVAKFFKVEQ